MDAFSELQRKTLLSGCMSLSHRVADLEARLVESDQAESLSGTQPDLAPVERRILLEYLSRLRQELLRVLEVNDIAVEAPRVSLRWALQTGLVGMLVAVDDLGPSALRGYGELSPAGQLAAERLQQQLNRIIDQAHHLLARRCGVALPERLRRVAAAMPQLALALEQIGEIVTRRGLIEFRPQLELIVNRIEGARLEIAVFGRVSSGKSSLLNHIAGQDVLPVGILPVTAVPTRLTWGQKELVRLEFAESEPRQVNVSELPQFASEAENPGNIRHVTRIEAQLPSPRLHEGIVFVDTPGLGSLARRGSAETLAYLPRCDLGIVLIDAASTINDDDVNVIRLLIAATTPVQVLLSKSDTLKDEERRQMLGYVERKLHEEFGVSVPVYPVSVIGQYEPLLYEWFDREVRPLREQHQDLSRASIARKIVRLAEAVEPALARLQRNRDPQAANGQHRRERAVSTLQDGDDVLRQLESFSSRWRYDAPLQLDMVFNHAAEKLVASCRDGSYSTAPLSQAVNEALAEHARLVWNRVRDAHIRLTQTLQEVAQASPETRVDVRAFQELTWEALPIADWKPSHDAGHEMAPWWESLWPTGVAAAVRRRLDKDYGREVGEAIASYDRRLDIWLRDTSRAMRGVYEAQTETIRGGSRIATPINDAAAPGFAAALEQDIGRLQEISAHLLDDFPQNHPSSANSVAAAVEPDANTHSGAST